MSCEYGDFAYTIRLSDLVLDTAGFLDERETAQRIARFMNYPVSLIDEAADKANFDYPGSPRFVVGRVLCLPARWIAEIEAEIEAEDAATEAANQAALQEQTEAERQNELVDNTVIPAYMLRTEEDFLCYLWVEEFDGSLSNFDAGHVRSLVTGQFIRVLMDMYDHASNLGLSLEGLPGEIQSFLGSERFAAEESLNSRSIADLLAFFELTSRTLMPMFEEISVILEDALRYDFYQQTYSDIQLLENGQTPSEAVFADYQADLATELYWEDYAQQRNNRLYLLADFVLSAAREGYFLTGFGSETMLDRDHIAGLLLQQLGTDWSPSDFAELSNRLVEDYWYQKNLTEQDLGYLVNEYTGRSEELALSLDTQSSADVADYSAALALDNLRTIAYDPTWNPAQDVQLLQELYAAIEEMPGSILGVDVGWVRDGMRAYYNAQKQAHDWRMALKAGVDQIELGMLNQQQQVEDPLWWLGLVGETILGFFDVFDAFFSFRDAFRGDLLALAFLAADIFLPVIGDAIMNIRRAATATDTASAIAETFVQRTDDLMAANITRPNGTPLGSEQYQQIEELRTQGINVEINDEFLSNEGAYAAFSVEGGTPILRLRSNATTYDFYHERAHALQYLSLGSNQTERNNARNILFSKRRWRGDDAIVPERYVSELYVWDNLVRNQAVYGLTDDEIRHANRYLVSLRTDTYFVGSSEWTRNVDGVVRDIDGVIIDTNTLNPITKAIFEQPTLQNELGRLEREIKHNLGLSDALIRSFEISIDDEMRHELAIMGINLLE